MPVPGLNIPPAAGAPPVPFERRLHTAILSAYDANSLTTLVQLDMSVALGTVVQPAEFAAVVTGFIAWAQREGRLAEFLRAAAKDKPNRQDLAALRDELLAGNAPPGGLPPAEVLGGVRRFADRFRSRREWFQFLRAYKQLHDLLHDLAGYTAQLRLEGEARRAAGTPVSDTGAAALRRWAAEAARWWRQTERPEPPPLWVTQLAEAAEQFLGPDAPLHARALARLVNLPPTNLLTLNAEMLNCARRLEPDELLADLDTVRRLIGAGGVPGLAAVSRAASAFADPCARLQEAIRHDALCQDIDTQLREARGMGAIRPDDILGWDVVRGHLDTLGRERPGDLKTAAAVAAAGAFARAPSAETFERLLEAFEVLFKAMDVTLLSVTTDLLLAATELIDALEGL